MPKSRAKSLKATFLRLLVLAFVFAAFVPEAHARRRERNKSYESWWNNLIKQAQENKKATEEKKESQYSGEQASGGESGSSTANQTESSQAQYSPQQESQSQSAAKEAGRAQTEYYTKVAKYYRMASSKTLAIGIVATAEGLGKVTKGGGQTGEGETLVASGLESLRAGSEFKKAEEATLGQIKEGASPKELDEELMADPIAEEVIGNLAQETGYSQAEVIQKILDTEGDLDRLTQEFEAAASRKEAISQVGLKSQEELEGVIEASKSGELRRKINFASLREALATSAVVASSGAVPEKMKQGTSPAEPPAAVTRAEEVKPVAVMAARAPASLPEFPNISENLPSFELEQSQYESATEASLFEKVHRKYSEIAPGMRRRK